MTRLPVLEEQLAAGARRPTTGRCTDARIPACVTCVSDMRERQRVLSGVLATVGEPVAWQMWPEATLSIAEKLDNVVRPAFLCIDCVAADASACKEAGAALRELRDVLSEKRDR